MPRKHTRKINIRGGGEETTIQKQIREELERILCIFTLDTSVRKDYTVSSFFDTTSKGATLIIALRDLYSSRSIRGSNKARNRNELIVRIIKLLIDESKMFRQIPPDLPGYQFKFRLQIPPPDIPPLVKVIFVGTISYLSFLLSGVRQCVGNLCNAFRLTTDEEAYNALSKNTNTIGFTQASQTLFERYNELKDYFDNNTNVSNEEYKKIAAELLVTIIPYDVYEEDSFAKDDKKYKDYVDYTSESTVLIIANHIKTNKLLHFISDLNYTLALWGIFIDYDKTYITRCLDAFKKTKDSKGTKDVYTGNDNSKDVYAGNNDTSKNVNAGVVDSGEDIGSMGGANLRHRKKTIKKQRRYNRSNLLFTPFLI
jgi:hypothetical protein